MTRAGERHLFVHATTEPEASDRIPMAPESVRACVAALPPSAVADLVVPEPLLNDTTSASFRRLLLTRGKVTDLFYADGFVWVGWSSDPEIEGEVTQVVDVPPPDQWPEFIADLQTSVFLWRWGDLTRLPLNRPWSWDEIEPDMLVVGMVGCSQNSLTRANDDFASEYPQVKRGSAHTCAATLLLRQGSRPEVGFEYLLRSPEAWRPSGGYIDW